MTESVEAESALRSSSAEAAWYRKSILSIDGGGVRGYVTLLFLEALMREIGRVERETDSESQNVDEDYFPCHYFDYMIGTGTGGLVAIMLSRLRMSIHQCLKEYVKISGTVFGGQRQRLLHLYALPKIRYDSQVLTRCVQELVERYGRLDEDPDGASFAGEEDHCKTVVLAMQLSAKGRLPVPRLFRSYDLTPPKIWRNRLHNQGAADSCQIWEAACATSAALSYFKPITVDKTMYVGGGFAFNNPSLKVLGEVYDIHNRAGDSISCLVSIGAGCPKKSKDEFFKPGFMNWTRSQSIELKAAYDSDSTHHAVESWMSAKELATAYFRFNVEADTWNLPLISGDTKEERVIRRSWHEDIRTELNKEHTKKRLSECARLLVQRRQERAKNRKRWRQFSS